jgi:hypothetical protein
VKWRGNVMSENNERESRRKYEMLAIHYWRNGWRRNISYNVAKKSKHRNIVSENRSNLKKIEEMTQ